MSYIEDRASWFAGQGLWQHLPESDWRDWNWQLKNRITSGEGPVVVALRGVEAE